MAWGSVRRVWADAEARGQGRRTLTEKQKRAGYAALESDNPELHAAFARFFQLREELQGEEAWEQ